MKMPWTRKTRKRADAAWERARDADQQLEAVKAQWVEVRDETAKSRTHKELNGWNNIARALIDGGSK